MFIHLIYVSKAKEGISSEDIQSILKAANRNNEKEKITGLLLYRPPYFVQFLEGTEFGLKTIMSKIEKDDRHSEIETIHEGQTQERLFPDWNMGHIEGEKAAEADVEKMKELLKGQAMQTEEKALNALKSFSSIKLQEANNF